MGFFKFLFFIKGGELRVTRTFGQNVPGDGVGDCREDPVQFAQRRLAIVLPPRDAVDEGGVEDALQKGAGAEPGKKKWQKSELTRLHCATRFSC